MDRKCYGAIFIVVVSMMTFLHGIDGKETEVRAHAGTNVTLPCRVDINQCGTLHSVKWYRDTSRIYVFSQAGQVARAEGDATERMTVEYNETGNETLLKISPVEVEDEATYKCEITYLEVRENCDVVQIVKLTTLVKPASVRILGTDGVSISNSTQLKPQNEGAEVEVICEAMGGKPIPTVSWYNGTTLINRASYSAHGEGNGVGTGVSKLRLTLSRGDLNARFECKVESQALDEPIISWITVDVNVRPTRMVLEGVNGHVVQGSSVYLVCDVYGARPAATVKWFNGSEPLDEKLIETNSIAAADGTFTTKSSAIFKATRWENGRSFNCYAENQVMKSLLEPAIHKLIFLDVRFPPVIRVNATKTVLNEMEKVMLSCTYYANPQRLLGATWLKDGRNFTRIPGKHQNGNMESPSLHIHNVTREDMGEYTCWLKNEVGEEQSEDTIFLDVHYPPDVEVIMEPQTPVKALDRGNVTLECNVTSGNPPSLRKVRWLLGGQLMAELPECNYTQPALNDSLGGPLCGIDPSILSLMKVDQSFAGNYTCQGENEAGYGPESEPQELIVYYPPSAAKLRYYPATVIKKAAVTLECTVDDPGRPDNVTYIWYRGSHQIHNITVSNWTIYQASLETRSNFTCIALNEGGQSAPATVFINVFAPPDFLTNRNNYKGVLYSSKNVSLTCKVECFPLCTVIWYKDGDRLNTHNNPLYYVNETLHPPDYNKNDFESIESTLIWNMTNWPNQQLNKSAPHSQYTCMGVSVHGLGQYAANFTMELAVHFPPEELHVSKKLINVIEGEIPDPVKCSGKGRPKLSYMWRRNNISEIIGKEDTLQLDRMSRTSGGLYICEASNKYGNQTINVYYNVQYKPDCSIEIGDRDGNQALICRSKANPQEVSFMWKVRESNDTIDYDNIINDGLNSYLLLDSSVDTYRTYLCFVNNSIGTSLPCVHDVAGSIPWYKRLDKENLLLIIASIVTLIICVIIVCIVIIVICGRKRANSKCNNPLEMEEREKADGQAPESPRWPGVLMMHSSPLDKLNSERVQVKRTNVFLKYRRNKSKVYARLERLRDVLGFGRYHRRPHGITEGANGVVTYKKIKPTTPIMAEEVVNTRKRKKPGYAPNPSSTGDKMRLGAAPPGGGSADPANDPDRGFYENLPFHGMQNPPNKPISIIVPFVNPPTQIQRHQSFHGFQQNTPQIFNRNLSNPYLQKQNTINPSNNFQPLLNFNPFLLPNPFSIPSTSPRILGRRETDIRRTASGINIAPIRHDADKKFASLELKKKHKCYSPTFYSMRCKKHARKRPIVYALPKKVFGDVAHLTEEKRPIPAPRCKKHQKIGDNNEEKSESLVVEAQVHTSSDEVKKMVDGINKNSPMLKVSPNFVKPQVESPKGALSLQIQAKRKSSMDNLSQSDDSKENLPLIPQMPLLNPQNTLSPALINSGNSQQQPQNAFYTLTTPHYKHLNIGLPPQYSATIPHHQTNKHPPSNNKLLARNCLFNDQQLPKSKSFSSKPKHKKPFQIPLQKCHSFKFQTAESYFQPIKNIHEEEMMKKNGYISDYPESSQHHHRRKQKTKGPLILQRVNHPENIVNSNTVQLKYPQPVMGRNGVVYADLDMQKAMSDNSSSKKAKTEYATLTFNDVGQEIDV